MKIALCIPCYGDPKGKFVASLAAMLVHTAQARIEIDGKPVKPEIETFIVSCSILMESRNRLVAEAINWGADYMLWMDADHMFPPDALLRLLGRNKLVIGCNYARRFTPTAPTASKLDGGECKELLWTTKALADADAVEEVAHLGLGLCLVDMRVYGALELKAVEQGKDHFWPLFMMSPSEDGIRFTGEDVYYFEKIREAGIPVHVDHSLSWDVGHIHEQILTNAHTVVQKAKWEEWQARKLDKFKKGDD